MSTHRNLAAEDQFGHTSIAGSADLAARIALLDDDRQIRNLIAQVAHLADYGDISAYMTCFTEDAEWSYVDGSLHGAAEIEADRRQRRVSGHQGPDTRSRHISTTAWVELDGSDTAVAHSYFLFATDIPSVAIADASDRPVLSRVGRYQDTLRRTPDGWKISRRQIFLSN